MLFFKRKEGKGEGEKEKARKKPSPSGEGVCDRREQTDEGQLCPDFVLRERIQKGTFPHQSPAVTAPSEMGPWQYGKVSLFAKGSLPEGAGKAVRL